MTELKNKSVRHKLWGTGIITAVEEKSVTIDFNGEEKKFVYPDAFKKFLTIEDDNIRKKTAAVIEEKDRIEEEESERKARERRVEEKRLEVERARKARDKKSGKQINNEHNVAFKTVITECGARFDDWTIRAGKDINGVSKRIRHMEPNSIAVLTLTAGGMRESDRLIYGVFLVDEVFEGNNYREGFIKSSPKYRIRLVGDEMINMKFWDFYTNPNTPDSIKWGIGAFRYLDDKTAEKILAAIAEVKKGTDDEALAAELLEYYRKTHAYTI